MLYLPQMIIQIWLLKPTWKTHLVKSSQMVGGRQTILTLEMELGVRDPVPVIWFFLNPPHHISPETSMADF